MRSFALRLAVTACTSLVACSNGVDKTSTGVPLGDSGGTVHDTGAASDDGGGPADDSGGIVITDAAQPETPQTVVTTIYAQTDTELYSMDPATKTVADIGPFAGNTGAITDLAVDASGALWVNSASAIYSVALPAGGTGTVQLTLKTTLPSSSRFYALGFVPAGVLGTGEAMIAGDGAGDLYFVDTSGPSATPQKLGSFGAWKSGDPSNGKSGDLWTLSGDVVFYMDGTTPRGIATLRPCSTKSGSTTCDNTNDVLAEIDMVALKAAFTSKTAASTLRKQLIGGGSGHGHLFGIGAWEANVYAFSRVDSTTSAPAQLLQIGSAGTATVLQSFPAITAGWSGAGVTTKATITVLPPPM